MEKNLEGQLVKVLEKGLQLAEKTGEFVIDQAPDVLREFYLWHIIDYSLGIILFVIILTIITLVIRYLGIKDDWDFNDGALVSASWVGGIVGLFSLFGLFYNIIKLVQIWLTPKYYLVDYLISIS